MFLEAEFWVLVAFVIFIAIVAYVGGFAKLVAGIDARGKRVRAELDEAKRLREEAAQVLEAFKRKREEAEREAQAMVAAAHEEAERTAKEAHDRLTEFVARRTASAEAKIAQAEAQATQQVRAAAAESAVRVAADVLREQAKGPGGETFLEKGLAEVRGKLHA